MLRGVCLVVGLLLLLLDCCCAVVEKLARLMVRGGDLIGAWLLAWWTSGPRTTPAAGSIRMTAAGGTTMARVTRVTRVTALDSMSQTGHVALDLPPALRPALPLSTPSTLPAPFSLPPYPVTPPAAGTLPPALRPSSPAPEASPAPAPLCESGRESGRESGWWAPQGEVVVAPASPSGAGGGMWLRTREGRDLPLRRMRCAPMRGVQLN